MLRSPSLERPLARLTLLDPRAAWRRAFAINPVLTLMGSAMVLVLVGACVGLVVDHQVITGSPAWLKPAKFALSIAVYSLTLVYLLGFVQGHRRLVAVVTNVTALGLAVEMILIAAAVVRGTTSHFNVSTPVNAAIWGTMGVSIVAVWMMGLLVAFLLLGQRLPDPAWAWALRFGILLALVGMGLAFLMTLPTSAQLTAASAGRGLPIIGAHSVAVPDGGPGLPILGWSTRGGDLRVPHFVGLHALQLMLIVGWLVTRVSARLDSAHRVALVWIGGLAYLGVIMLLTWQALRGQSLVRPDAATLGGFGALVAATIVAVLTIVVHARGGRGVVGTTHPGAQKAMP